MIPALVAAVKNINIVAELNFIILLVVAMR